jgi:hypothetical protein
MWLTPHPETLALWAILRLRQGVPKKADELFSQSFDAAQTHGVQFPDWIKVEWKELSAVAKGEPAAGAEVDPLDKEEYSIRKKGKFWHFRFGTEESIVPDRVGMKYIEELLTHPNEPIDCFTLAGEVPPKGINPGTGPFPEDEADMEKEHDDEHGTEGAGVPGNDGLSDAGIAKGQEMVDRQTRSAARRRLLVLAPLRDPKSRAEAKIIKDYLKKAFAPGGKTKRFNDPVTRVRTKIQKAIFRVREDVLDSGGTKLHSHLRCIDTGYHCVYQPNPVIHWVVVK